MTITERFIRYTQFDTQSCEDSSTVPSTAKQLVFARFLKDELIAEGLSDVEMDDMGYIYATLKTIHRPTALVQISRRRLLSPTMARSSRREE